MQSLTNENADSLRVMATYGMVRKMKEVQEAEIRDLMCKIGELEAELAEYRQMATSYGIDAKTMCTLAKSQIKTCADNIRLQEENELYRHIFRCVGAIFSHQKDFEKLSSQLEGIAEERASWL